MAVLDPASPGDPESGGGELHLDPPPPLPIPLTRDLQCVVLQLGEGGFRTGGYPIEDKIP